MTTNTPTVKKPAAVTAPAANSTLAGSRLLPLARETARVISRSPGVVAVALTGSLATGQTRDGSDIDFAVYWKTMPTQDALEHIRVKTGGGERSYLAWAEQGRAVEDYPVQGVKCDLSHATVANWEADMNAVLVDHAVPHPAQGLLAGLLDAVPLYGHALHAGWQARARPTRTAWPGAWSKFICRWRPMPAFSATRRADLARS